MNKLSKEQLSAVLRSDRQLSPMGSTWSHRKGGVYVVDDVALSSDDLSPVVVYRRLDDLSIVFVRPQAEFLDGRFKRRDPSIPVLDPDYTVGTTSPYIGTGKVLFTVAAILGIVLIVRLLLF